MHIKLVNDVELMAGIAFACVCLGVGLIVSIYGLRHSLNIIRTKQFQRPLTGRLITGRDAVWIGVIRAFAAGVSLVVVLGLMISLVLILCIAALK